MLDKLFKGLFDSDLVSVIEVKDFIICIVVALLLGLLMTLTYMYKTKCTKSFLLTIALLPTVVCVVIMMVNGNIGTGVAVAGAFSLVRFRSAPGNAKEICMLFLGMATGLIIGMGYLAYAILFTIIMCIVFVIYNLLAFSLNKKTKMFKSLVIVIPEELDYTNVFDDIFKKYTQSSELIRVKSTNMGSMFKLKYDVILKNILLEKQMLDEIRCRNGNLEITISNQDTSSSEL